MDWKKNIQLQVPGLVFLFVVIISLVPVVHVGWEMVLNWEEIKGFEAYWIAKSLAAGEGYSFPSSHRWLFPSAPSGTFHPTAWVDPLYTFILSFFIKTAGPYHKLVAGIFNLALLFSAFVLTYLLSQKMLSRFFGLLAVLVLLALDFGVYARQMNNTLLATVLILLSGLALNRFMTTRAMKDALLLGFMLGLTALGCPSAQFFLIATPLGLLAMNWRELRVLYPRVIAMVAVSLLTVLPWTVRNYFTFQDFIPVRSGAGQIAFIGVVAAGGTVFPSTLRSEIKPPWTEKSIRQAVYAATRKNERTELENFQMEYMKELAPVSMAGFNEAKRDSWFLKEVKDFIKKHPVIAFQFSLAKLELFSRRMGHLGTLVFGLACLGTLFAYKNGRFFLLSLWMLTYVAPFILILCYWGRYRAPFEPVLVILSLFASFMIFKKMERVITNRMERNEQTRSSA